MKDALDTDEIAKFATSGYYIAIRVGYAFPRVEINRWPSTWTNSYVSNGLMPDDPTVRWIYGSSGSIRWSAINIPDPRAVMKMAAACKMKYGASIVHLDEGPEALRSFGSFARPDREFTDQEIEYLREVVVRMHQEHAPPTNLTRNEITTLDLMARGLRMKEVGFRLGTSEGAIKQRIRLAKTKLDASTTSQAIKKARDLGII